METVADTAHCFVWKLLTEHTIDQIGLAFYMTEGASLSVSGLWKLKLTGDYSVHLSPARGIVIA